MLILYIMTCPLYILKILIIHICFKNKRKLVNALIIIKYLYIRDVQCILYAVY